MNNYKEVIINNSIYTIYIEGLFQNTISIEANNDRSEDDRTPICSWVSVKKDCNFEEFNFQVVRQSFWNIGCLECLELYNSVQDFL